MLRQIVSPAGSEHRAGVGDGEWVVSSSSCSYSRRIDTGRRDHFCTSGRLPMCPDDFGHAHLAVLETLRLGRSAFG
jgi:hypothetical protein